MFYFIKKKKEKEIVITVAILTNGNITILQPNWPDKATGPFAHLRIFSEMPDRTPNLTSRSRNIPLMLFRAEQDKKSLRAHVREYTLASLIKRRSTAAGSRCGGKKRQKSRSDLQGLTSK